MNKNLYNTLNKQELLEKLSSEKFERRTCSFYKYMYIEDPISFRDELYLNFNTLNILGRIYIAKEGINAQISIPKNTWHKFKNLIQSNKDLKDARINHAVEEGVSFYKLKIKIKNEIVTYDIDASDFDMKITGQHLNSDQFNKEMDNPDSIVLDMRNNYESEVGRFEGAILPNVETSRELLPEVTKLLEGKEDNQILLYCTGGIRCEKASSFLIKKGFKNVKQLEGGVINYANDVKSKKITSKFIGKNFVFDARLGESVTNDVLGKCYICKSPADNHGDCKNQICHILFLACSNCAVKFAGCCSAQCKNIAELPIEKQKILRKKHS
tara:strand:+ start:1975 stop:2952 length:978 start_codon:yes stop_codon:yes gene_type:complete